MSTQFRSPSRYCLAASFLLIALAVSAKAQTPWEAAPARPAPLPAARPGQAPTRVTDLPKPPPSNATAEQATGTTVPQSLVPTALQPGVATEKVAELPVSNLPKIPLNFGPPQTQFSNPGSPNAALPPLPDPLSIPLPGRIPPPNAAGLPQSQNVPGAEPASAMSFPASKGQFNSKTLVSYGGQPKAPIDSPELVQFQSGELVAVVGTDHILAGDMNVFIDPIIEKNRDKIRDPAQEVAVRNQLTRQILGQYVEVKAMYQEFFRDMVGTAPPEELEDMKKQVVTRAGKIFFEKQVPTLMERYEAHDLASLEAKLREKSMSLTTLRTQFIEQVLSSELERKYIPQDFEVEREEILESYRKDREKWQVPARARWRQITIRFDKHESRAVAEQLINQLGYQMYLGGKSFDAVARESSEGLTASNGGLYDWTSKGSLKSQKLDEAIFTIELNRLSQVIEDDIGFHIIEVLERQQAHTKDLAVSQAEIRDSISAEKREKATEEFRKKIMKRTPIWTRWPEDIPGSRPLEEAIGTP